MSFAAPHDVEPTADERELLLAFLQLQRELIVAASDGLDEDQARWTPPGRLTPIIGLINHLTHVEWRWIDGAYLREPVSRSEAEFAVGTDRTLGEIVDAYFHRAERTNEIVRSAPSLNEPCASLWSDGLDLRYVLIHLIEETAHHAGHADSTREMLDGTTSDW